MKICAGLAAGFLVFALVLVNVQALPDPIVTFIPEKFSANASFIAVADPGEYSKSIRVRWQVFGIADGFGSFPRSGNRWVCYFSNTDEKSTCGPTPFYASKYQGSETFIPYTFSVNISDAYGQESGFQDTVNAGDIELTINITTNNNGMVDITVWSDTGVTGVSYKTYNSSIDLLPEKSGSLVYYTPIRGYIGNISLGPGEYYMAFAAQNSGGTSFGGDLVRFVIKGEETGGAYVPADLEIDAVSLDVMVTKGQSFSQGGFRIRNLGNESIADLSTSIISALSPYLSITLGNSTIEGKGTIYFTVNLNNIQNSMEIGTQADIVSNGTVIGRIPVNITISVMNECDGSAGGDCPACVSGDLSISPSTWIETSTVGETIYRTFTLSNLGNSTMDNISYSATGTIGSIASVVLPNSIAPGSSGIVNVSLSTPSPGRYSGTIEIDTGAGTANIVVSAEFFQDISGDVDSLQQEFSSFRMNLSLDQENLFYYILDDIDSDISSADSYKDSDYTRAKEYYDSASAKFSLLQNVIALGAAVQPVSAGGGFDFTLVIIVVVVLVVVFVAFKFLKKHGLGSGKESAGEEEFEDDAGSEEEF